MKNLEKPYSDLYWTFHLSYTYKRVWNMYVSIILAFASYILKHFKEIKMIG